MNLQSPLSAAEFLDVDTKEFKETEGTLTTDAFYNWFEAMRKKILSTTIAWISWILHMYAHQRLLSEKEFIMPICF